MAIEKPEAPAKFRRQILERFVLAIFFVAANLTGRIEQRMLDNLFSWSSAWTMFGFLLFMSFGVAFAVTVTFVMERLLKGVFKNIGLMIASVFLAILTGTALVHPLGPVSAAVFGLDFASEVKDLPALLVKSLISAILFTLLFRHEDRAIERLNFAKNLANSLVKNQKQLIETEERQRSETSRFLHDRVQAQLMVLSLQIANVEKTVGQAEASELWRVRTKLENLRSIDLRRVGQMLTPNIQDFGLQHCLRQLVQHLEVADRVELRIDETLNRDAAQLQLGIYRIVEQALINAITHGPASLIEVVAVLKANSTYELSISDDGPGAIVSERTPGYGTAVIQSWVSILGAQKEVFSAPGQGYKLIVTVPLI